MGVERDKRGEAPPGIAAKFRLRPTPEQIDSERGERSRENLKRRIEDLGLAGMGEEHPTRSQLMEQLAELESGDDEPMPGAEGNSGQESSMPGYIGLVPSDPPVRV